MTRVHSDAAGVSIPGGDTVSAMTMLEKAARAACRGDGENPDQVWYENNEARPLLWQRYLPVVRAVLQAVREPGERAARVGADAGMRAIEEHDEWAAHDCNVDPVQPPAIFAAMIDAILNEAA